MQFFFSLIKTFGKGGCETCIRLKKMLSCHLMCRSCLHTLPTEFCFFVLNKDLLGDNFFQFLESQEKSRVHKFFFRFGLITWTACFFFASVVTGEAYLSVL